MRTVKIFDSCIVVFYLIYLLIKKENVAVFDMNILFYFIRLPGFMVKYTVLNKLKYKKLCIYTIKKSCS